MTPAAHRLTLSAAEIALLVRRCGVRLPPGFVNPPVAVDADGPRYDAGAADDDADPDRGIGPAELRDAASALAERQVVTARSDDPLDCVPVPAVAANLAVLAQPGMLVRAEAAVHGRGSRAAYAVAAELGASLFALADGAVELSLFPAPSLGRELTRAVPDGRELAPAGTAGLRSLGGAGVGEPPTGRLPLAALVEYGPARQLAGTAGIAHVTAALRLTEAEAALADRVSRRTVGVLRCTVSGPAGDGLAVGQVVWLATEQGWLGLRPEPDPGGRRMVTVTPVERNEFGAWLAPMMASILDGES